MLNSKHSYASANYWDTTNATQFPEEGKSYIRNKEDLGIAFSGGGNRSAPLTLGYLRTLHKIGVLSKVKYISAVSGGAWASVPYTFLDSSIQDETFLGDYIAPEDLDVNDIKNIGKSEYLTAPANSEVIGHFFRNLLEGDEFFASILNKIFLTPFFIGNRKKLFTLDHEERDRIIANNKSLKKSDFYITKDNRPFLIVNAAVSRSFITEFSRFPLEITPLYTGVPKHFPNEGANGNLGLGGCYIESFAFDSDAPESIDTANKSFTTRLNKEKKRFSLSDVIAATGSAPADIPIIGEIGFPEFKYWTVKDEDNPKFRAKEYDVVDGGYLDNTGVLPLLSRKVSKIIAFINTNTEVQYEKEEIEISNMIQSFFLKVKDKLDRYDNNVCLTQNGKSNAEIVKGLKDKFYNLKKQGLPLIITDNYQTMDNQLFGVVSGHSVEITWVHNSLNENWLEQIKDYDVKETVLNEIENNNFPHYATFFENSSDIIDLKNEQATLLAHLASHTIMENVKLKGDQSPFSV
ncbi:patatin-like phospholipase family protein [Flammeovirga sp. SJP92]|uniref:patatin-like phospholipase family protein n=1 Tax=Flammeovirga sp. SJP92 TaxID=1775430 RepID=UPI0007899C01|nr:patatin-like phospholipase family protein [Flammeovirga sp. SJP92]KXX69476.1 hypothetical protein AVL50_16295 [Flammeovirga sp. SJP92]